MNAVALGFNNQFFFRAAVGACIGSQCGQPATFATNVMLLDLFWKYVFPNTFGKAFFLKYSYFPAEILAAGVSFYTSFVVSDYYYRFVSDIPKDKPFVGRLAREADNLRQNEGIVLIGIIAMGIIGLKQLVFHPLDWILPPPPRKHY